MIVVSCAFIRIPFRYCICKLTLKKGIMDNFSSYHSGGGNTSDQLQKLSSSIISNVQKISQNVKSMQLLVNQLGTDQDCQKLRTQLHEVQHYTGGLAKDTTADLRNFQNVVLPTGVENRPWKLQAERLTKEFTQALNDFQAVQRQAAAKEKQALKEARAQTDAHYFDEGHGSNLIDISGTNARGPSSLQISMEQEADMQTLQEREQQIRQLESDIMDVNQIFKDLATMVHEQGEVIDSIEANMESAQVSVTQASSELLQARTYQNRARRKKFILILIGLAVFSVVVGIIIYSAKN